MGRIRLTMVKSTLRDKRFRPYVTERPDLRPRAVYFVWVDADVPWRFRRGEGSISGEECLGQVYVIGERWLGHCFDGHNTVYSRYKVRTRREILMWMAEWGLGITWRRLVSVEPYRLTFKI